MDETRTEILDAAREALAERGYADASMSTIAGNFDGSQSLIHYHFDDKEDLLAAVVARTREQFTAAVAEFPDDPADRLDAFVDLLVGNLETEAAAEEVVAVFSELTVASRRYDAVADELEAMERRLRTDLVETVERGVETGAFVAVDPEHVADLVLAANERAASARLLDRDADVTGALEGLILSEVRR